MGEGELLEALRGGLIASVQAYPGEPLRHPETMAQIARACELGGAVAIRCQGLADIAAVRGRVQVPVIGLWKDGSEGVHITPTYRHAEAVAMAGADIIALDATERPRPDGSTFEECAERLLAEGRVLMADCACADDARRALAVGCQLVSTTLAHGSHVIDCGLEDGPDLEMVRQIRREFPEGRVVCEGRVHSPAQARAALDAGAWAVVAGTAITHPTTITRWFDEALRA